MWVPDLLSSRRVLLAKFVCCSVRAEDLQRFLSSDKWVGFGFWFLSFFSLSCLGVCVDLNMRWYLCTCLDLAPEKLAMHQM